MQSFLTKGGFLLKGQGFEFRRCFTNLELEYPSHTFILSTSTSSLSVAALKENVIVKKPRSKFPSKKPIHRVMGTKFQVLTFSILNTA